MPRVSCTRRAAPGRKAPCPNSAAYPIWFPASGEGRFLFELPSSPGRSPSFRKFFLASRWQMGYLPLRAVRWAMPEYSVEPAMQRRSHQGLRPLRESCPVFFNGTTLRCLPLRIQAGMSRRGGSGMTRERPVKSGFSGCEQKKHCLLPRLGIWTFDCVREVAAWGR